MLEKLLLAAALTLSVQIFAGAGQSAKLPKGYVSQSLQTPVTLLKHPTGCTTLACAGDRLRATFSIAASATYGH